MSLASGVLGVVGVVGLLVLGANALVIQEYNAKEPASAEALKALESRTDGYPAAKAILDEGLEATPKPTRNEFSQLEARIESALAREIDKPLP